MEGAAGGGFGFLHGIFGEEVSDFGDEAGGGKSLLDVIAFEVNIGIDFVREAVVALIALEADIVSGGADPNHLPVQREGRLPDAQVIAGFDDLDGFGVGPAIILRAAEEIELAHGHGEIGFLLKAGDGAEEDGGFHAGIHVDPSGRGENFFHGVFVPDNQKVDHIAGITLLIADAAGNFGEEIIVNAGDGLHLVGNFARRGGVRGIDFDLHCVGAGGGIAGGLIDSQGQFAADGRDDLFVCAEQEWLRHIGIADPGNECATARTIIRKVANEVFETAGLAAGTVIGFGVEIAESATGRDNYALAGFEGDAGVRPNFAAVEGEFLGEGLLGGGGGGGGGLGCGLRGGGSCRGSVIARDLRSKASW